MRLTSFKSLTDQRLPLEDLTVLIGRNGSGKSNALDGLMVLSRLALGEPVRDALDGPRSGGVEPTRGGAERYAPLGADSFRLGCRVRTRASGLRPQEVVCRCGQPMDLLLTVDSREWDRREPRRSADDLPVPFGLVARAAGRGQRATSPLVVQAFLFSVGASQANCRRSAGWYLSTSRVPRKTNTSFTWSSRWSTA
ncbi:AAA family ATPase [Streptomyces sp. NPDC052682]|uniref:AAA family ATPase n=1 Tax=Streptomyces sp. NPDC052682 TaxID=3154954 RepID=UPI0034254C5A